MGISLKPLWLAFDEIVQTDDGPCSPSKKIWNDSAHNDNRDVPIFAMAESLESKSL